MTRSNDRRRSYSAELIESGITPPLLSARNLCFEMQGQPLLQSVNLSVRAGRRTIVIGPNGAGKSLLLRLLHGLIPMTTGDIYWKGQRFSRDAQSAQAMVFQRPVLLRRSVLANLKFALKVCGFVGPERARRVQDALRISGLMDVANRPARVLSGGEQQRLAIARALVCAPELLLLDEPTANLDPAATSYIETLIDMASGRGITVVMVTHDQGQARRLADDLVFLQDGRVEGTGVASDLFANPRSEAMKAWLDGRLHVRREEM
ncbi:MAG: ATP-binding cassette domain-containing protein [Aestuariivita sp.]|nr:ATP-binding cassette domain-containing protein [Aestuariivita sp.]